MHTRIETLKTELDILKAQMNCAEQRCLQAEERQKQAEDRQKRATRRARILSGIGFLALLGGVMLTGRQSAGAEGGTTVTLAQLLSRVITLEVKTQYMAANTEGKYTRFTGCNVYVQSGSGATDDNTSSGGSLTGLGNLIVGYNLPSGFSGYDVRTGSHNLILGDQNNYSSYGGLVAGQFNTISGSYASVSGGRFNVASGGHASVGGGLSNTASGTIAWVSGGSGNTANNTLASVSGGGNNIASGDTSAVSGGQGNIASRSYSSICGGYANRASGYSSSVCGGFGNKASGQYCAVLGGASNEAYGTYSIVCGGDFCVAGGFNPSGDFTATLGGFGAGTTTQYAHVP